jgi:hypothetical protein
MGEIMRIFVLLLLILFYGFSCTPQWAINQEPETGETNGPDDLGVAMETLDEPVPTKTSTVKIDEDLFEKFKIEIQAFWEAPYVWGGASPQGTDCSGMIMTIYRKAADIKIPRNTRLMWEQGDAVAVDELQMGDLLFFNDNGRNSRPTHVGMFIDKGVFIHASVSRGVTTDQLSKKYYRDRYLGARRFLN